MSEHPSFVWLPPGEPVPGQTYRADGWSYHDLPRFSPDMWDEFLGRMDGENYVLLTLADYGDSKRGQILVSPEGRAQLAASVGKAKEPSDV